MRDIEDKSEQCFFVQEVLRTKNCCPVKFMPTCEEKPPVVTLSEDEIKMTFRPMERGQFVFYVSMGLVTCGVGHMYDDDDDDDDDV